MKMFQVSNVSHCLYNCKVEIYYHNDTSMLIQTFYLKVLLFVNLSCQNYYQILVKLIWTSIEMTGLWQWGIKTKQRNKNGKETDRLRKYRIRTFKNIGFRNEIATNLKSVDFLNAAFNLETNSH